MSQLSDISRAHAWLQSLRPLPAAVVEELRHRYEVRFTYHSTAIEGNTLTQSETQVVLEKGVTIAGKSLAEHLEVIGHKEALDLVLALAVGNERLGERQIREIHSLVMKGDEHGDNGAYRNLDVRAAGTDFVYPGYLRVPELMAEFGNWLDQDSLRDPIERASEAHLRFVTIHPFRDGNGRVGRLLMNLLLIQAGYPIAVLPVTKRIAYIDALSAAQAGSGRAGLDALVRKAVMDSLRDTLSVAASSAEVEGSHPELVSSVRAWLSQA